jgi:hypothetical protein
MAGIRDEKAGGMTMLSTVPRPEPLQFSRAGDSVIDMPSIESRRSGEDKIAHQWDAI